MSSLHMTVGSRQPTKVSGKVRLYSNTFCPYSQRVRLVLRAKNIPHDVININLIDKPEWYHKVNPDEKVPALDTGSRVLVESLDIVEYLENQYPNPPLYPSGRAARQRDRELIRKVCPLTSLFNKCIFGTVLKSASQWLDTFAPYLDVLEDELERRRSTFFGGDKPGMVDYVIWPWAERAGTIAYALREQLPFHPSDYPLLRKWRKGMRGKPVVAGIYVGPERFWKVVQHKIRGTTPDFDAV